MELAVSHQISPQFSLQIEARFPGSARLIGLTGPSGAGKSSLLKALAGLTPGASVQCGWLTPSTRVGLVFQEPLLFPHLSVKQNLELAEAYGQTAAWSVQEVIEGCGCRHLLDEPPDQLSGGEAQRVALARSLVNGPHVLLLDEPVSALDDALKTRVLSFLQQLCQRGLKVLMVSHDLHDLALYCDAVGYLSDGKMLACGEPDPVLESLSGLGVERRRQFGILRGQRCQEQPAPGCVMFECEGQILYSLHPVTSGEQVQMSVDARDVSLDRQPSEDSSIVNGFQCEVLTIGDVQAGQVLVELRRGETRLYSLISQLSLQRMALQQGETVTARFKLR